MREAKYPTVLRVFLFFLFFYTHGGKSREAHTWESLESCGIAISQEVKNNLWFTPIFDTLRTFTVRHGRRANTCGRI